MAEEKEEVLETQSADGAERRPYQMRKGFEISSVNKDSNDLEEIRRRSYVYVAKTAWLHRLAMAEGEKMFFLARQRSFGKSSFLMNF